MATKGQTDLILKLRGEITALDPRAFAEDTRTEAELRREFRGYRASQTRAVIDALFANKRALAAAAGTTGDARWIAAIPAGMYAVERAGETRLFKIDHGRNRWAGRLFAEQVHEGDDETPATRITGGYREFVLTAIAADVAAAAALYDAHSPAAAAAAEARRWIAAIAPGRYALPFPTEADPEAKRKFRITHGRGRDAGTFAIHEINGMARKHEESWTVADDEREAILTRLAADTEAAARAFGHTTGICGQCYTTLTNPKSIAAGIGPVCSGKVRGRRAALASA